MPKKKLPLLKMIGYFILGMLTFSLSIGISISFPLGVIIGAIWIKFKTKEFRKEKLIALILGFVLAFIVPFIMSMNSSGKSLSNLILSKIPEVNTINQSIMNKYPDITITSMTVDKYISGDNKGVSAVVVYKTDQEPSKQELLGIGSTVCDNLDKMSPNTSNSVKVEHQKPRKLAGIDLPIYTTAWNEGSCESLRQALNP